MALFEKYFKFCTKCLEVCYFVTVETCEKMFLFWETNFRLLSIRKCCWTKRSFQINPYQLHPSLEMNIKCCLPFPFLKTSSWPGIAFLKRSSPCQTFFRLSGVAQDTPSTWTDPASDKANFLLCLATEFCTRP